MNGTSAAHAPSTTSSRPLSAPRVRGTRNRLPAVVVDCVIITSSGLWLPRAQDAAAMRPDEGVPSFAVSLSPQDQQAGGPAGVLGQADRALTARRWWLSTEHSESRSRQCPPFTCTRPPPPPR